MSITIQKRVRLMFSLSLVGLWREDVDSDLAVVGLSDLWLVGISDLWVVGISDLWVVGISGLVREILQ